MKAVDEWDRFLDGVDTIGRALVDQGGLSTPEDKYEIIFNAIQAYEQIEPGMIEISERIREKYNSLHVVK